VAKEHNEGNDECSLQVQSLSVHIDTVAEEARRPFRASLLDSGNIRIGKSRKVSDGEILLQTVLVGGRRDDNHTLRAHPRQEDLSGGNTETGCSRGNGGIDGSSGEFGD